MPVLNQGRSRIDLVRTMTSIDEAIAVGAGSAAPADSVIEKGSHTRAGIFEHCANPRCQTSWLRMWRSRSAPVFEGGWTCCPECTTALIEVALAREMEGRRSIAAAHRHRVPLGLLMLEQGWITSEQLRKALAAQRTAGRGRLGQWLMAQKAVDEEKITRALGLQWSCPVLTVDTREYSSLTPVMPRLFVDAFQALPLRLALGKVLYLGFEESLDPSLALAVERMHGLRVESGIVKESHFHPAHSRMIEEQFPAVELVEATSLAAAAHALAKSIERFKPIASRLVRAHACLWLRLWLRPQRSPLPEIHSVRDIVCSIGALE